MTAIPSKQPPFKMNFDDLPRSPRMTSTLVAARGPVSPPPKKKAAAAPRATAARKAKPAAA